MLNTNTIVIGFEIVLGILILAICIVPFIEDPEINQMRRALDKK